MAKECDGSEGFNQSMKKCWEVFWRFLLLGCVSFGGPAAHIGYFHRTFVIKLNWLNEDTYAKLLSLSQILPGPGSSQLGFALGLYRAGLAGGLAAFIGFTLPSFLLMYWLAISADLNQPPPWLNAIIQGLKLCAVVVVLDAVVTMFGHFCKTQRLAFVALLSALIMLFAPSFYTPILIILMAALAGSLYTSSVKFKSLASKPRKKISWFAMILFIVLFLLSLLLSQYQSVIGLFATFYKSGSLVFGGGHVVLPLLQSSIGDALTEKQFLFGYAAAQGIPGPMFTMATFMGAQWLEGSPLIGATIATLGIFLPGFLLVFALRQSWQIYLERPKFVAASATVNAAVVGLLAAAFYQPVLTSTIQGYLDIILAILGFVLIRWVKVPILAVIGALLLAYLVRTLIN